jgi:multisubunit Na+/H+ antiporter MnhB subunit
MTSILLFALLIILCLLAFRVWSGLRRFAKRRRHGRIAAALAEPIGAAAAGLVGLLAGGVGATERKDDSNVAPSGGVLNYRTGKLDDGTDPVGWYEED